MALIERTAYPRFGPSPPARELAEVYTPTLRELGLAEQATRGGGSVLGFLVMLKSFQRLGYFPKLEEVPETVVAHLRSYMGFAKDATAVPPRRSRQRYRNAIREHLGVNAFGEGARRVAAEAVAGAAIASTPETEMQMGMGFPIFARAAANGIPVGIGSDIQANNSADAFAAMRLGMQGENARWAQEILESSGTFGLSGVAVTHARCSATRPSGARRPWSLAMSPVPWNQARPPTLSCCDTMPCTTSQ